MPWLSPLHLFLRHDRTLSRLPTIHADSHSLSVSSPTTSMCDDRHTTCHPSLCTPPAPTSLKSSSLLRAQTRHLTTHDLSLSFRPGVAFVIILLAPRLNVFLAYRYIQRIAGSSPPDELVTPTIKYRIINGDYNACNRHVFRQLSLSILRLR